MSFPPEDPDLGYAPELSDQKREIARLLLQGLTNRQIAVSLGMSEEAVKNHMNNIKQALHQTGSVNRKK